MFFVFENQTQSSLDHATKNMNRFHVDRRNGFIYHANEFDGMRLQYM